MRLAITLLCALAGAPVEDAGRGRALVVACGDYPALRASLGDAKYEARVRLRGPANDAALVRRTLVETLSFAPEDVTTLAGWPDAPAERPTLRNVLAALAKLAESAGPGDRVILYFAGHGVQQPDANGDEADGLDEVFLPADAARFDAGGATVPNGLVDDEIAKRVAAIRDKGAFVWLVMDTCHSGTMLRGGEAGLRFRRLDPDLLGAPEATSRATRRDRKAASEMTSLDGIVAFYATQSFQLAPEMPLPTSDPAAEVHGLLTFTIASHLARSGGALTFRELGARVVHAYQALPYDGAMPLVEGDVDRAVAPGADGRTPTLFLTRRDGELALPAGTLLGIEPGTRLVVSRPATRGAAPAPIARAEVESATLVAARCRIVEGADAFAKESESVFPVEIASRPFGPSGLSIAIVSPDGGAAPREALPAAARAVLEREDFPHAVVAEPERADVLLVADGERSAIRPARAVAGARVTRLDAERLEGDLARMARSRNLKRVAANGLGAPLPRGFEVWVHRVGRDGKSAPLGSDSTFRPGDLGRVTLVNRTGLSFDVTALYLDADGGVTAMFPVGLKTARVSHADTGEIELVKFRVNDEQLGVENLLLLAVPRAPNEPVADFAWIADGAGPPARLRGESAPMRGFSAFLRDVAFSPATRGITLEEDASEPAPSVALFTWRTAWGDVAPPEDWLGARPIDAPPAAAPAAGLFPLPDPWALGPRVALAKAGAASAKPDLLLSGGERPDRVLVDADGDAGALADRSFDAEAAFVFEAERRVAFYDTDDDGRFDLALVDRDADPIADERWVLEGDAWREDSAFDAPFLSTGYLRLDRTEVVPAMARFAVLARE